MIQYNNFNPIRMMICGSAAIVDVTILPNYMLGQIPLEAATLLVIK